MTSSVYLNRQEEVMLDQMAGANQLPPNSILRIALRELYARSDQAGRLPLVGVKPAASTPSTRDV